MFIALGNHECKKICELLPLQPTKKHKPIIVNVNSFINGAILNTASKSIDPLAQYITKKPIDKNISPNLFIIKACNPDLLVSLRDVQKEINKKDTTPQLYFINLSFKENNLNISTEFRLCFHLHLF